MGDRTNGQRSAIGEAGSESGTVIVWAMLLVIVTSGMVLTHTSFLAANRKAQDARYNRTTLAQTFSRSGMMDALGWFHRQPKQPVTSFAPVQDPNGNPPRIDTIDPTVGLVREFVIDGSLWGRYEVRHAEAVDISKERGELVPGSAWEIGVRSYIYRVVDPSKEFDQAPNRMIATSRLTTEIRAIQLTLPSPAAVAVEEPTDFHVGRNVVLDGGDSIAIAFRDPAAAESLAVDPPAEGDTQVLEPVDLTDNIEVGATVKGRFRDVAVSTFDATPQKLFAMRLDELRSYADYVSGSTAGPMPRNDAVIFIPRSTVGTKSTTMTNVLVVIDGNWISKAGHSSRIDGIVYVTGDVEIYSDMEINGALIVRGKLKLANGKYRYDPKIVANVVRNASRYRLRRGWSPIR